MNKLDKQKYIDRYNERLNAFGYDPKTLGWGGGRERQDLRYKELMAIQNFIPEPITSVLDIGCGFADMYEYISANHPGVGYIGIDINPTLLKVAREIHGGELRVATCDILDDSQMSSSEIIQVSDLVVSSGIFNFKLDGQDQLAYIDSMLRQMFSLCRRGVASDFMTTYVDWQADGAFHIDPAVLFKMAKTISPRVVMRHDYLPYEYCIYLLR